MGRFVGRENVRKHLAPLEGKPGTTTYADGAARVAAAGRETIVARPPFGLTHEGVYPVVYLAPLFDEIGRDRVVGAMLVRLGGYAVGVFDGERLVASKVGSRFVKNRHKKGGSSANRFRRRREEQTHALFEDAATVAARVLEPWRDRIEVAVLGGDRRAVASVLDGHPELGWLKKRASSRFLDVREPRQHVLERLPYDLYAVELEIEQDPAQDRVASPAP
jgi:hypothetical protein